MDKVIQLVPKSPAAVCGVGDYARLLAAEWQRRGQTETLFLEADIERPGNDHFRPTEWLGQISQWLETLPKQGVKGLVLHYSGYGYSRKGVPLWLMRKLRFLSANLSQVPIMTMFHEVAASGPMNTSAFWLSPIQLYVARRLMSLSDVLLTNCEANARVLRKNWVFNRNDIRVHPVFSNFGESEKPAGWAKRVPRMVVFTSNFGGQAPSCRFWESLSNAVAKVGASEVAMIGRPIDFPAGLAFRVVQTGFLKSDEVSGFLENSAFGYVFHGPLLLGKSGVFAAFAAHGVVPLIQTSMNALPDGLTGGVTYHPLEHQVASGDSPAYFAGIGSKVRSWYGPHGLSATVELYDRLLAGNGNSALKS